MIVLLSSAPRKIGRQEIDPPDARRRSLLSLSPGVRPKARRARMSVVGTAYRQYLDSPAWRRKRQQRLDLDNRQCTRCEATEGLEVHHLTYERLGNERLEDLETLCGACHAREHGRDPKLPPIGGLTQRELTERGKAKYWLERWQEIVEKAAAVDSALSTLHVAVGLRSGSEFEQINGYLGEIMRDCAYQWRRDWEAA